MKLRAVALLGGLFILSGASEFSKNKDDLKQSQVIAAKNIDLKKMMGTWHEIARLPNQYQKQLVANQCHFSINKKKKNSEIKCIYTGTKKTFNGTQRVHRAKAWPINKDTNGQWDMQFLWPFKFSFWILDFDEKNYNWIVAGHPKRHYLWFYARTNSIPEKTYDKLLKIAQKNGYKINLIEKTPQPIETLSNTEIVSINSKK